MPYPWECIDCTWLDTSDVKWGDAYCKLLHRYVEPGSASCDKLNKKSNSGKCYLTTFVCDVLGYEDDCFILETLRDFRDNYMKKNEEYKPLLEDYDVVGPMICDVIKNDPYKHLVSMTMLNCYITPAISYISSNDNDSAIEVYKNMTLDLMHYCDLDEELLVSNKMYKDKKTRKIEF